MRNSYIANTHEAAALNIGKQTAVVVKMKVQPPKYGIAIRDGYGIIEDPEGNVHARFKTPYKLWQEVYVREAWITCHKDQSIDGEPKKISPWSKDQVVAYKLADGSNSTHPVYGKGRFERATNMPKCMSRTRFKVLGVEAVRVMDVSEDDILNIIDCKSVDTLGDDYYNYYRDYLGSKNEQDWPWFGETKDGVSKSWQSYIISKFGQQAWDENHFIWYFKIEKI
jgi:hypothetical protein